MSTSLYIVNHMIDFVPHQEGEAVNLADAEEIVGRDAFPYMEFERAQIEMGWPICPVEKEYWVMHHYLIDGFNMTHRMRHYQYTVLTGVRPLAWADPSQLDAEGWVVFK